MRGGAPSFKHYNNRGDVVAATDENSSLTYQAAYEAFGRHGDTASSEEWGTNPDRQQANTKDEDPTGLLNEGFRYRDLETGTFITRDPLGFVDDPNVYTYVVQNPWTKFDPLGLREGDFHKIPQKKYADLEKLVMYLSLTLLDLNEKSKNEFFPQGHEFSVRIVYDEKTGLWSHGKALEGDHLNVSPFAPLPENTASETWKEKGWIHNHPGQSGDIYLPVEKRDPFSVGIPNVRGGDKVSTPTGETAWVVDPLGDVHRFDKAVPSSEDLDRRDNAWKTNGIVSYVGNAFAYLENLVNSKKDNQPVSIVETEDSSQHEKR